MTASQGRRSGPPAGSQPQRTELAWQRTALAGLALTGVVAKVAADHATALTVSCAAVVALQPLVGAACSVALARAPRTPAPRALYRALAASTAVACAAAALAVVPT